MSRILLTLGIFGLAAGAFAFVAPSAFFSLLASYTGDNNLHLVRDVGAAYLTAGAALFWAGMVPAWRAPLTTVAAMFLALHGVGHVLDLLTGAVDPGHLALDAIQVFVPALLVGGLAIRFLREHRPQA